MTGMHELNDHQEGNITLKCPKVSKRAPVTIVPEELRNVREKLNLSQAVFAHYLHTCETTCQKREQGRVKPNSQAVLLIRIFNRTLKRCTPSRKSDAPVTEHTTKTGAFFL
jgi:putative transcriptional regulator